MPHFEAPQDPELRMLLLPLPLHDPTPPYFDLTDYYPPELFTVPGADDPSPANQAVLDQEASAKYDNAPTVDGEAVVTYGAGRTPDTGMHSWLSPEAAMLDQTGGDQAHPGDHPADKDQT